MKIERAIWCRNAVKNELDAAAKFIEVTRDGRCSKADYKYYYDKLLASVDEVTTNKADIKETVLW